MRGRRCLLVATCACATAASDTQPRYHNVTMNITNNLQGVQGPQILWWDNSTTTGQLSFGKPPAPCLGVCDRAAVDCRPTRGLP